MKIWKKIKGNTKPLLSRGDIEVCFIYNIISFYFLSLNPCIVMHP